MLELIVFILLAVVVPMLVNKTTEGHLHWLKPQWLRLIWTVVFAIFSLYLLQKPAAQEFVMVLHQKWPGAIGYALSGVVGAAMLTGYWWLTGAMLKPPPAPQPPLTPATQQTQRQRKTKDHQHCLICSKKISQI